MKCIQADGFGSEEVLHEAHVDMPSLPEKAGHGKLLVRVLAVSLSPSDYRTLSGDGRVVKNPSFPFIPGGDLVGQVVDLDPLVESGPQSADAPRRHGQPWDGKRKAFYFRKGGRVAATWDLYGKGGLAEYCLVDAKLAVPLDDSLGLDDVTCAAMTNSPAHAAAAVRRANVKKGERVLILGGSGGVGTIAVQLVRNAGASFLAATSTDTALLERLGVDMAIDYTTTRWDEIAAFVDEPFDVIIDCAEGYSAFRRAAKSKVLKKGSHGGRFIALVLTTWHLDIKSVWQLFKFFVPVIGRVMASLVTRWWKPKYVMHVTSANNLTLARTVEELTRGDYEMVIDRNSPHPFTEAGVRDAYRLHTARRGKGKIVIRVAGGEESTRSSSSSSTTETARGSTGSTSRTSAWT